VKFIRTFDHLFDILNSRNPCAKGFKAALRKSNKHNWESFLDEAREYIIGLKNASGDLMYTTRRKTGFVGFLVAINSIKGHWQRKFLLAISILLDNRTMKILSFPS
jgi:hypothetical protein